LIETFSIAPLVLILTLAPLPQPISPSIVLGFMPLGFDGNSSRCATSVSLAALKFAWTNQQADSARTYVALDGNGVAGYYALTTGSVHKHESPQRIAKGLANHPISVVLIARLAVHRTQHGRDSAKLYFLTRCLASRKLPA
jgi:hypothetical protein